MLKGMLWIVQSGAQWREEGTLEMVFRALSAGNDHDSVHAVELLEKVKISGSNVLADRAYGAKAIRAYISGQGASYVIPPQSNVSDPWPVDWRLYKERHLVECFFQKLITPELEHRKSGYVERKRRPYQGNVVRIA